MQSCHSRARTDVTNQQAEWLAQHLCGLVATCPAEWTSSDLTLNQLMALQFISARSPISLTGLSEELGTRSPATCAMVDRLSRAGLVCRSRDPEDRRRVRIEATGKARAMVGDIDLGTVRRMQAILTSMSTPACRYLHEALGETARHLTG